MRTFRALAAQVVRLPALAPVVIAFAFVSLPACATYRDQLARSQQAFERKEDDRALALLRNMEGDLGSLSDAERAQYAYLRGMTDYRAGYRVDARHWLGLAKAYEDTSPGILPSDWKGRTAEALEEMNAIVQDDGFAAFAASKKPGDDDLPTPKKAEDEPRKPSARGGREGRDGDGAGKARSGAGRSEGRDKNADSPDQDRPRK